MNTNKKSQSGRTILGICIIMLSFLTILWGHQLFSTDLTDPEFMSFFIGGVIGISIGLCIIKKIPQTIKQLSILLAAASIIFYCFILDMDLILKLMSATVILAIALWLIPKFSKTKTNRSVLKICKKCSNMDPTEIENFCLQNDLDLKFGCIHQCGQTNGQYAVLFNKQMIQCDQKDKIFESLNEHLHNQIFP